MYNSLHTQANREKIINSQQTGSGKPTLEQDLKTQETVYLNMRRNAIKEHLPKMQATAENKLEEINDQLSLLLAIESGLIKPVLGGRMKLVKVQS